MSNLSCRIGKVKFKSGGSLQLLPDRQRTHFHKSVENLSKSIDERTHAVGFFILRKDHTVVTGISYDTGFTAMELQGACEYLKSDLMDVIWGSE